MCSISLKTRRELIHVAHASDNHDYDAIYLQTWLKTQHKLTNDAYVIPSCHIRWVSSPNLWITVLCLRLPCILCNLILYYIYVVHQTYCQDTPSKNNTTLNCVRSNDKESVNQESTPLGHNFTDISNYKVHLGTVEHVGIKLQIPGPSSAFTAFQPCTQKFQSPIADAN